METKSNPVESTPAYLRLSCPVQCYAWGKVGMDSQVAQLKSSSEPREFVVDQNQTYSELWMGTHAKGPASISQPERLSGQLLSDWIQSNTWALGEGVVKRFGSGELPFLFKVLSINKALSIQAHPAKEHAQKLHQASPELYRDPNHKPEMAIAVSEFEGFCGFRPYEEIRKFVWGVAELRELAGDEIVKVMNGGVADKRAALKEVFTALMESEERDVKQKLSKLLEKIDKNTAELEPQECELVRRLNSQFPGDIGCFCVFFLNFVKLQPGEALYLAPNEPHAYISGDVVECMACSDNVVRAGLTVKYKDKETLCQMLTYNMDTPSRNKFPPKPHPVDSYVQVYDPPTPEFAVNRISIPKGTKELTLSPVGGPSILLVISGTLELICGDKREDVWKGVTLFLPTTSSAIQLLPHSSQEDTLLFQAYSSSN